PDGARAATDARAATCVQARAPHADYAEQYAKRQSSQPPVSRSNASAFCSTNCVQHPAHRQFSLRRKQVRPKYGERATGTAAATRAYQDASRRNTRDAFVPPKPNELDKTTSMSRLCALCGTKSRGVSTDGLSRLMVGGATLSRMASTEKIASTAPAAPSR